MNKHSVVLSILSGLVLGCGTAADTNTPNIGDDDQCTGTTWYIDADNDTWGNAETAIEACVRPDGYTDRAGDCDDTEFEINPDVEDICNGIDDNCDGVGDTYLTWYPDNDDDGYGIGTGSVEDCERPIGYSETSDDCDDTDPDINPGVVDDCDGVDEDCDGDIDEDAFLDWTLLSIDHRTGTIWEVDRATGTLTDARPLLATTEEIPTMDSRDDGLGVVYDSLGKQLMELDACTGQLTAIGPSGAEKVCGIAFGPNGELFGMDNIMDTLLRFDLATGEATTIGPLGLDIGACGLAFDCQNDIMYGADARSDQVFQINLNTGAISALVSTDIEFISVGLEYDPSIGMLLASSDLAYYQLDPTTGTSTLIGGFPAQPHINDLSFYPACP